MSDKPQKLRIYLDITGGIVKSNVSFKANMITDVTASSKSSVSKLYASTFYFTDKIKYTKALFKKYNLDNVKLAVKIFTDENKSRRFFKRLQDQEKKKMSTEKTAPEDTSKKEVGSDSSQDRLNLRVKNEWNNKIAILKQANKEKTDKEKTDNNAITQSQLQELREDVKRAISPEDDSRVDSFITTKTLQKALLYAEKEYISSQIPKNDCPPNCLSQNITFLLDLFFKQRQQIILQGKKYTIIKATLKKTQKQSGINLVSIALKVFDSSKPQDALVYYDCKGKKTQIKNQLMQMFPNVFDFFDIDANVAKTQQSIAENDKIALINAYSNERSNYRKLLRQLERLENSKTDNNIKKIDELEIELDKKEASLDRLESLLRKHKLFGRISNTSKTRRSRFQSRSNRNSFYDSFGRYRYNYRGGKKKYTKKRRRNIRMTKKKRKY